MHNRVTWNYYGKIGIAIPCKYLIKGKGQLLKITNEQSKRIFHALDEMRKWSENATLKIEKKEIEKQKRDIMHIL